MLVFTLNHAIDTGLRESSSLSICSSFKSNLTFMFNSNLLIFSDPIVSNRLTNQQRDNNII